MSSYSNINNLNPPLNRSNFTFRVTNINNGQSNNYNGMPSKDGFANNDNYFAVARLFHRNYKNSNTVSELETLYNNYKPKPQTNNTIVKTTQYQAGKPISQNSNDLYIQRLRMNAIGRGSSKLKNSNDIIQYKGGSDINYVNKRLNYCKAGGSIAPCKNSIGPSQPSILSRKYNK